jgi:HD-like signal output (HDOD) protein
MTALRVLFVEDDETTLTALRGIFTNDRERWDVAFARGSKAALDEMAARPADLVVTDARIPESDGATLLRRIQQEYPATTRVLLSSEGDRGNLTGAATATHQQISRPPDARTLRGLVERVGNLRRLLQTDALRAAVGKLETLPPAPKTYLAITAAMLEPSCGLDDVANVVEQDPSLSAKLLQLVNSAFFGLPQRIASVRRAVAYLGFEQIKGAALAAHVFGHLPPTIPGFSFDQLQLRGAITAQIARRLVTDAAHRDEAFTAAVLHDVGLVALAVGMRDKFEEIVATARRIGASLRACTEAAISVSHAEIGAYLLGTWGLPMPIVEAVAYHHFPALAGAAAQPVLAAVHAADVVVDRVANGAASAPDGPLDAALLARAGIPFDEDYWVSVAREHLQRAEPAT